MATETDTPGDTELPPEQEIGPRLVRARQEQELRDKIRIPTEEYIYIFR